MQPKTPKLLEDIREAAARIQQYVAGKSLEDYRLDSMLRDAVERNFEIVGEAMGRLAKLDPSTASRIGDYPRIIAFRNLLIHGYDLVNDEQVWKVIHEHLPALHDQVVRLLGEKQQP